MELALGRTPLPGAQAERRGESEPSGLTLEKLVLGAWEDLEARGRARCPVCRDELTARGCGTCGSELS
jgi:tRNA(Ile2) C34 agmatinyltransferase TiaS